MWLVGSSPADLAIPVTLLGMAYKKDVDDPRESPGFELMELLIAKGAAVQYNDPHIPVLPAMRRHHLPRMASQDLTAEYLASQDCLIVATNHTSVQLALDRRAFAPDRRYAQRPVRSTRPSRNHQGLRK